MDILINVILVGLAVAYATELIATLLERYVSSTLIKMTLTLPLALFLCWGIGLLGYYLAIGGAAAAFISLALLRVINRPDIVQTLNRR